MSYVVEPTDGQTCCEGGGDTSSKHGLGRVQEPLKPIILVSSRQAEVFCWVNPRSGRVALLLALKAIPVLMGGGEARKEGRAGG